MKKLAMPQTLGSLSGRIALMIVGGLVVLSIVLTLTTSWLMANDAKARASERQEANMRVARDVLSQYGDVYSVRDGKLYAGDTALNGLEAPVDRVKALVGGTATIFLGDMRVSTNVMKRDGSRATGTPLKAGPVHDTLIKDGKPYRGEADILGVPFFTAYDPIKDASGAVIGILYVGIPQAEFMQSVAHTRNMLMIVSGLVTLLAALFCLFASRRLLAPLEALGGIMDRLAKGETAIETPWETRPDDIGQMARAVARFRDAAIDRLRLENEAGLQRNATESERAQVAAEKAREAADDQALIETLAEGLAALADGQLTYRITAKVAPKAERLKHDFNLAAETLNEALAVVAAAIDGMQTSATEITSGADELSRRTEQQAASLEETAAALDEITATVRMTAESAVKVAGASTKAMDLAQAGGQVAQEANMAMAAIADSADKINQIIGVIDEIAFQTNLLALNAGVEAARAGDSGRGFAVVASEVRALAQRSAAAAKEIKILIGESSRQVSAGVELVDRTGVALTSIVVDVEQMQGLAAEIAGSAREQSGGLQEVNVAVNQMDQMTQQNAAMVEESTAASHMLAGQSRELAELVSRFELTAPLARAGHRTAPRSANLRVAA